jgi:hypothetical protein
MAKRKAPVTETDQARADDFVLHCERTALGAVLLRNDVLRGELNELRDCHFLLNDHRQIFRTMMEYVAEGIPFDDQVLAAGLMERGRKLKVDDSLSYLEDLPAGVVIVDGHLGHLRHYEEKIIRAWQKRELRRQAERLALEATRPETDPEQLCRQFEADLATINCKNKSTEQPPGAAKPDHEIADDLLGLFRRFIAAPDAVLQILAIWALHTHCFLAFSFTPYLVATSAEKHSGKTTVLSVLKAVVRKPLKTASISPAALARVAEQDRPTALIDECDIQLDPKHNENAGLLRGILNDGFHVDGSYTRMVGTSANMSLKSFSTYFPKALAGIGQLEDTIASRSIIIRLQRAPRGRCESFRPDGMGHSAKALREELNQLRTRARGWAERHSEEIANSEPRCPESFNARQRDISEPLIAICDVLGSEWPAGIGKALAENFAAPAAEDTSKRVQLLGHIRKIFLDKYDFPEYDHLDKAEKKLRTEDLLAKLCAIDDAPWSEWNGKAITSYGLSKLLKPFEIRSKAIRDPNPVRGYILAQFLDAFECYLSPVCTCKDCTCHEACSGLCSGLESATSANVYAACSTVADFQGGRRGEDTEKVN